jgi:hypothetical protein
MRKVNFQTKIQFVFKDMRVIFGGAFFMMGMVFSSVFIPETDLVTVFFTAENTLEVDGVVLEEHRTNTNVNDENVRAYSFAFTAKDGQTEREGTCYSTTYFSAGDNVSITYRKDDPTKAVVTGTSAKPFPFWTLTVLMFPIVGFVFLIKGVPRIAKKIRIFRDGLFTEGVFVEEVATNVSVNDRQIVAYKYVFEIDGEVHSAEFRGTRNTVVPKSAIVMYLKDNPHEGLVIEGLPSSIRERIKVEARQYELGSNEAGKNLSRV